jgi:hypothetical protein
VRVNAKTCGPRREVGFGLFGPNPLRLPSFSEAPGVRVIPKSASSVKNLFIKSMVYLRTNRVGLFFHTLGGGNSLAFVVPSVGARKLRVVAGG